MKKSIQSLLVLTALAFTASTSHAQSSPKILTVDLAKIFDGHYKTVEQMAKLKADGEKAQEQMNQIQKEGQGLVDQYKELVEQAKNPTATSEAKDKATAEATKKGEEIRQKQQEQQEFYQTTQRTLQQRSQTFKQLMIEEITKVAVDVAKRHGATFLIDKSGPTLVGVSNILYADPSLDITDEVMAEINKDRPAATPTPVSTTPAASTDAPKITLPGVTPDK